MYNGGWPFTCSGCYIKQGQNIFDMESELAVSLDMCDKDKRKLTITVGTLLTERTYGHI